MTNHNLSLEAIMEMSPEDFSKLDPAELLRLDQAADDQQNDDDNGHQDDIDNPENNDDDEQDDEGNEDNSSADQNNHSEQDDDQEEDNADDQGQEEEDEGTENDVFDQEDGSDQLDDNPKDKKKEETKQEEDTANLIPQEEAIKYRDFFTAVTATFKANGTDFTITDPNDIISLMQKGLNYNQKMAGIKPYYALIETMKENGLTNAQDLGFLIDIKNKKPEAIAKLLQESGHDAYDLNEEKANGYVPTQVDVSARRGEMLAIEQEYQNDPDFSVVLGEISTWDEASKKAIMENPSIVRMIMDHKKQGILDQVMPIAKQELALGRTQGSLLNVYDQVGRAMFAAKQQDQGVAQAQQQAADIPQNPPVKQMKQVPTNHQNKQNLEAAKKAASMTRNSRKQAADNSKVDISEDDIWNMSPEELAKVNPKFLKG